VRYADGCFVGLQFVCRITFSWQWCLTVKGKLSTKSRL